MQRTLDGFKFISSSGSVEDKTLCIMSAVAYLANEPHSDRPACACPVLTEAAILINDGPWWADANERTAALAPIAERLVGTRSTHEIEHKRSEMFVRACLSEFAPDALDLAAFMLGTAGLADHSNNLLKAAQKLRKEQTLEAALEAEAIADYALNTAFTVLKVPYPCTEGICVDALNASFRAACAAKGAAVVAARKDFTTTSSLVGLRVTSLSDKKRIRDRLISLLIQAAGIST